MRKPPAPRRSWQLILDGFSQVEPLEVTPVRSLDAQLVHIGHAANAKRIYDFKEMEADHVTAWSKGGATDISNCQMLCKSHNRAKGNV